MKIFISGKMTGVKDYNFPAFNKAEGELAKLGFEVLNPASTGVIDEWEYKDYMRASIDMLLDADAIYMLWGWRNSAGATLEHQLASLVGMPVCYQEGK